VVHAVAPPGYVVIVNPQNPATEVDRTFLSRAFLKKVTRWPHGVSISPVDLKPDSDVRRHFAEDALGRSVSAIRNAWQQAIFSGRDVPPPELDSDADVVSYVLKHPGGIGYVSPGANLNGAHAVTVK
jgi:ABC-type phosphate transport system substrate-binding protein